MRNIGGALGRGTPVWLLLISLLPGLTGCQGFGGRSQSGCASCQPAGPACARRGVCQGSSEGAAAGCNGQAGCGDGSSGGGCAYGCGPNCYIGFIDSLRVRSDARANARYVLRKTYGAFPRISCHYADGFEQAFVDLAEGGDGSIPPIPPKRYWNAEFRCPAGSGCAQDWFVGYEAGVAAAGATVPCPHPVIPVSGNAWLAVPAPNDYSRRHQNTAVHSPDGQ